MGIDLHFYFSSDKISDATRMDLIKIDHADFPNPWTKSSWESFLSTQNFALFTLSSGSKLLSYAVFLTNAVDSLAHLLKIVTINTEKNKGFGDIVLKFAMVELKKIGLTNFFLEVEKTNVTAISLYKRNGFEIVHQKKDFYGSGKDALIMTVE